MITVGLIGCGGMGAMHANCYLALADKVKLVAIADLSKEKAEKYLSASGAKYYETGKELLENEKPDIIDICLPTYLHTEYAAMAMKKGASVFLEKPVCLNEEEAKLLLKTKEETGAKIQIGQVVRFMNEYVYLRDAVKNGTYGKVKSAYFYRLSSDPHWSWEDWFNDWKKSGTVALDLHVHDVDVMRYIFGEPDEVTADVTRNSDGVIDHIYAGFKYGDTVVKSEGCWDMVDGYPFSAGFRVCFEKATMEHNGRLTVRTDKGECFTPEFKSECDMDVDIGINVSNLGAYYTEIKYFIENIIEGNGEEIAPLSEGIASAMLVKKEIALAGGEKVM